MDNIEDRITNLRKLERLTQYELAQRLNVSDKVVSKWECGETTPSLEDINSISKFFKVSLDYLINGKSDEHDKLIINRKLTTGEMADDFIEQCKQIIKTRNLQKFKEILLPSKVIRNARPEYKEDVTSLSGGVFKGDKYWEWQKVYTPYIDIKKLLSLDYYDLYLQLIDLPATFGELRYQLKQKNDIEALKQTEPKDNSTTDWTREQPKNNLSHKDIKGLTDIRFYNLLSKQEDLNSALEELNENNKNYWEIVYVLIGKGAYKTIVIDVSCDRPVYAKDTLATQMLLEIARMKKLSIN